MSASNITRCLREIFKDDSITEENWRLDGNSGKEDGYNGEINFITLMHKNEELHLAIKSSKPAGGTFPIKDIFRTEINIYTKIMPEFVALQKSKNIKDIFDVPTCYSYVNVDDITIIALENLKTQGYTMVPKSKHLNRNIMDCVLRAYGRFHALSFALKDQNFEKFVEFNELLKDYWLQTVKAHPELLELSTKNFESCQGILKENGVSQDLMDKIDVIKNYEWYNVVVKPEDSNAVITHGDCWVNNFMFKFEDEDQSKYPQIKILDWQLSKIASPVNDLSYFIFATASAKDLDNLNDLLKVYHDSLSNHLKLLGSNPEKLYSFSDLLKDWKKNAIYGATVFPTIIGIQTYEDNDDPGYDETVKNENGHSNALFGPSKSNKNYVKRVMEIMTHPEFQKVASL